MTTKEQQIKKDALEEVNAVRGLFDKSALPALPIGRPGNPSCCPIALALHSEWVGECAEFDVLPQTKRPLTDLAKRWDVSCDDDYLENQTVNFKLPMILETFVAIFDAGGFPELEIIE
jgi:hypothetical protein